MGVPSKTAAGSATSGSTSNHTAFHPFDRETVCVLLCARAAGEPNTATAARMINERFMFNLSFKFRPRMNRMADTPADRPPLTVSPVL
jgi:hypothetical protein